MSESGSSTGSSPVLYLEKSPPPDPGYCLCEFCILPSASPPNSPSSEAPTLVGPGVGSEPHVQCGPALSVVHAAPIVLCGPAVYDVRNAPVTLGSPALSAVHTAPVTLGPCVILPTPSSSPNPPLTSLTGALFRLPETLPLTLTPYFAGEVDANVKWVQHDEAIYKEIIDAMADDCFVYLYRGMLYNMPAVAAASGPYYCVTRGRYIGVFKHWDEVTESITGCSDVVYAVTSLAAGEVLLRTAIHKGEVHKCRVL
ncbi:hypothetical protein EV702DRAFT_1233362 [Suillus placidus]|uniref:Ribonuclease H1 N-terminal domain-containing protein n=1 Tax=Suillus placidus TaxID=48579 RepID=A0A9P7D2D5_9AGAM|nr:hypothetical protein EV702DRAFT_1233362 [Suillus placidus]